MKTVKMTMNVPESFHTLIKTYSSLQGTTIKDLVVTNMTALIKAQSNGENILNKDTLQALEDSHSGQLNIYQNINELFTKLDQIEKNATNKNH